MMETNYEKYLVRKPLFEVCSGVKNRQSPAMTYISSAQIPEVNNYIEWGWINGIPEPNPHIQEHVHKYDEIILHIGSDPDTPQNLGADIECYIGGQQIVFNTTTAIFIPKGIVHGPVVWKAFRKPHIQMSIMIGTGSYEAGIGKSDLREDKKSLSKKTVNFDYEQYVVRSPYREVGGKVQNRQMPTMTYISRHQVLGVNYYSEFGWIFGMPEPNPHVSEHTHNYDEVVLHFGNDPDNPESLGGEIEYCIEGQPLSFSTNTGLFVPKGVKHGPLTWKSFSRPHIEMTLIIGAGTFREVWTKSALDVPRK